MQSYNPYQPPATADLGLRSTDDGEVPPALFQLLAETKPWVRFLSVLGFIGTGLMALLGLVILGTGGFGELPGWMGLVYALLGGIYLFPSLYLSRYGASIDRMMRGGGMSDLVDAIAQQKSFWRLVGIMTLVMMGLYVMAILIGIVVGVANATH